LDVRRDGGRLRGGGTSAPRPRRGPRPEGADLAGPDAGVPPVPGLLHRQPPARGPAAARGRIGKAVSRKAAKTAKEDKKRDQKEAGRACAVLSPLSSLPLRSWRLCEKSVFPPSRPEVGGEVGVAAGHERRGEAAGGGAAGASAGVEGHAHERRQRAGVGRRD